MKRIYKIYGNTNYQYLLLKKDSLKNSIQLRNAGEGKIQSKDWNILEMKYGEKISIAKKGDYTSAYVSTFPIFSEKAKLSLIDLLEGNGQFFPINCKGDIYFGFGVEKYVDILDNEKSIFNYILNKYIASVKEHIFDIEKLKNNNKLTIFRLQNPQLLDVYVTEIFLNRVIESNLEGFDFWEVWNSEGKPLEKIYTGDAPDRVLPDLRGKL